MSLLDEIERCRDELGLAGISFHTRFEGVSFDSRWITAAVEPDCSASTAASRRLGTSLDRTGTRHHHTNTLCAFQLAGGPQIGVAPARSMAGRKLVSMKCLA
jgi:hypothetical protein